MIWCEYPKKHPKNSLNNQLDIFITNDLKDEIKQVF